MTVSTASPVTDSRPSGQRRLARYSPLSGVAFVVLFIASVIASSPPSDNASDATWIANYTGGAHKAGHLATGVCLVLAGLCLVSFMTLVWTRIGEASRQVRLSPLPVIAAGVAAACMAVGGVLMGGATTVVRSGSTPSADLLRLCNDLGFVMVGLGAMLATALCLVVLAAQARSTGFFGRKMTIFSIAVAVILLASVAFIPIVALLAWLVVVSITFLRHPASD